MWAPEGLRLPAWQPHHGAQRTLPWPWLLRPAWSAEQANCRAANSLPRELHTQDLPLPAMAVSPGRGDTCVLGGRSEGGPRGHTAHHPLVT